MLGGFTEKVIETCPDRLVWEISFPIDQVWDIFVGEGSFPLGNDDMHAHRHGWQLPGYLYCLVAGFSIDHQACTGKNALLMSHLDGSIDLAGIPKIITVDDDLHLSHPLNILK